MRWWGSRWVQAGISVGAVALIFGFVFPKLADYDTAWDSITDMSMTRAVLVALVALWNFVSYIPLIVSVLPGLRWRDAAVANFASTAVSNTLPGGGALGVGVTVTIERSYGFSAADIARGAVVSGVWNNFAKLGLPVVALAMLAFTGDVSAGLVVAAFIGLAVLATLVVAFGRMLRHPALARRVGHAAGRVAAPAWRLLGRPEPAGWDHAAERFRADTGGLIAGRAERITVATVISHASLFLVLLVCLRAVGVTDGEVGWIDVLAAYAFVRLLSAIPITPGGLGVVELGLTASLGHGLPGPIADRVAAGVLLYRALTWFVPIPLGIASWLYWRSTASRRSPLRADTDPSPLQSAS
jgi:uncharacterized membrane protein YbhN (UPF0104 family)